MPCAYALSDLRSDRLRQSLTQRLDNDAGSQWF